MSADRDRLIAAARAAAAYAYAPYSGYHVGAALLLCDGAIISAANFENVSYGLTLCAETVAIAKANSEGKLAQIREIAIIGGPGNQIGCDVVTPCGRCRQVIKEVADITRCDIPVHCGDNNHCHTYLLSELLPHAFGPANLK